MDPFHWTQYNLNQLTNRRYDALSDPRFQDRVEPLAAKFSGREDLDHVAAVRGCWVEWADALNQPVRKTYRKWIWFWGGLHDEGVAQWRRRVLLPCRLRARFRNQVDFLPVVEFEPRAGRAEALIALLAETPIPALQLLNITWDGGRAMSISDALCQLGYDVDPDSGHVSPAQ